jgi:hypothetical protein
MLSACSFPAADSRTGDPSDTAAPPNHPVVQEAETGNDKPPRSENTTDAEPETTALPPSESEPQPLTDEFLKFLEKMKLTEHPERVETDSAGYAYRLQDGALAVTAPSGAALWTSPPEWWVSDFGLGDVDGDGVTDCLFTLWKSYRFGEAHPARMENDDAAVRCHLFLYTARKGGFHSVWGSSDLPAPIYSFELDPTGKKTPVSSGMLLHTMEGAYTDDFRQAEALPCEYYWEGWGFVPVD